MPGALILVTGRPATGKSTLAQMLADTLKVPVISKDSIKELLFDTLGQNDREWSTKLGRSAFALMDYIVEAQLRAGNSIILESPLNPQFENEKFQKWQKQYNFRAVQIICEGDSNVLFERFRVRAQSGERHSGHQDAESLAEFKEKFQQPVDEQQIDIDSTVITVDTTDIAGVSFEAVCQQVATLVKR